MLIIAERIGLALKVCWSLTGSPFMECSSFVTKTYNWSEIPMCETHSNHRGRNTRGENWILWKGQSKEFAVFDNFMTMSSHFFDNYLNIFYKTEDQTVILRCWTDLNHNWFKSYDTKRKWGKKESVLCRAVSFHIC